jgi:hypothetical protein
VLRGITRHYECVDGHTNSAYKVCDCTEGLHHFPTLSFHLNAVRPRRLRSCVLVTLVP